MIVVYYLKIVFMVLRNDADSIGVIEFYADSMSLPREDIC